MFVAAAAAEGADSAREHWAEAAADDRYSAEVLVADSGTFDTRIVDDEAVDLGIVVADTGVYNENSKAAV